jgi:hypothetical protein
VRFADAAVLAAAAGNGLAVDPALALADNAASEEVDVKDEDHRDKL